MECVVSAKSAHYNRIFYVTRFDIAAFVRNGAALQAYAARTAPLLLGKTWQADIETGTDHVPLPVAMLEAGNKADNAQISWPQNYLRLRTLRADYPDDPSIMLMDATHLHTRYITRGRDLLYKGEDTCAVDEAEIEQLVPGSLDYAQSRPEVAIMAAKLLYFVDRGYKSLALQLASDALPSCVVCRGYRRGDRKPYSGETPEHQRIPAPYLCSGIALPDLSGADHLQVHRV